LTVGGPQGAVDLRGENQPELFPVSTTDVFNWIDTDRSASGPGM